MKDENTITITIKNLVIQFDSKGDNPLQEAEDVIDLINSTLQSQGLEAQIMSSGLDSSDIEEN